MRDAFLQFVREACSSKPSSIACLLHPEVQILVRQGSVIGKLSLSVEKQTFKNPARKLPQIVAVLLKLDFEIRGTEIVLDLCRHGVEDLDDGQSPRILTEAGHRRTSLSSSTVISLAKLSPYSSTASSIRLSDSAVVKNMCLPRVNNAFHLRESSVLPWL